jgi:hypothetical protein
MSLFGQSSKENIRFYLAYYLGLKPIVREIHIFFAKFFIYFLPVDAIHSVYLRRSILNDDFVPFLSDMDMTLVLNPLKYNDLVLLKKRIGRLKKVFFLIKDIEYISIQTFSQWQECGGVRSYQYPRWQCIKGNKLPDILKGKKSMSHHAFDLFYELMHLYIQFEKIAARKSYNQFCHYQLAKFQFELTSLISFWSTKNTDALDQRRKIWPLNKNINAESMIKDFYLKIDYLADQLFEVLEISFKSINVSDFVLRNEDGVCYTNKEFNSKLAVFSAHKAYISFTSSIFLIPKSLFGGVIACGFYQHDFLIKTAKVDSYYRNYLYQRCYNDLLGAIFNGNPQTVLYTLINLYNYLNLFTDHLVSIDEMTKIKTQLVEMNDVTSIINRECFVLFDRFIENA